MYPHAVIALDNISDADDTNIPHSSILLCPRMFINLNV
jgi:hypothetical protein